VDRLYRPAGFGSDLERVEHLFALFEPGLFTEIGEIGCVRLKSL
jgi:hypothetical protein